jgi:hypothetical protein
MNKDAALAFWLVVATFGPFFPCVPGLEISAPDGLIPSRCIPASVEDNVVRFAWSEVVKDGSAAMVRIYVGSGGLSGVNLCRPLDNRLCGLPQTDEGVIDGMCPLNGSAAIYLKDGLHIIHLLVANQDGHPTGAHETVLLQVNETFWMFECRVDKRCILLSTNTDTGWTRRSPLGS